MTLEATFIPERKDLLPIIDIHIPEADGYSETEDSILCDQLAKHNLLSDEYVYTAFTPILLDRVLTTGTFHESGDQIDCCQYILKNNQQIIQDDDRRGIITHVESARNQSGYACIAILRKSELTWKFMSNFKFNNPDNKKSALIGIVKVHLSDYAH